MQAIILAAGMGSRLKHLTQNNTKCMVKVNGVSLIDRMLHQLDKQGLSRIVIVVGYEAQKLKEFIGTLAIETPIVFIDNPVYETTNNIYSLALAGDYLCKEDTLLLESDLIFEDSVLDALVSDPRATLALVDRYARWMDGTCIRLDSDDRIVDFIPGKKFRFEESGDYYKTVNIYKFSKRFSAECYVPFLEAYQKAMGLNEYYEQVLRVISVLDTPRIRGKRLEGQLWYEIDDEQDLEIAESMFLPDRDARTAGMIARGGGYWRYPTITDYSSAVNPFFPPKKLIDEMQMSFTSVLKQRPSDARILSLLAAKNFSVKIEHILAAPGKDAALQLVDRQIGSVSRSSFDDIRAMLSGSLQPETTALLVTNPDPVSGAMLQKTELEALTAWASAHGNTLIIDESLADFAESECSLLSVDYLTENPHLILLRDISACRGIPGLCLAVLLSGDTDAIAAMKKLQSCGSIGTVSEFYMQIEEKYKKDYAASLARFRTERTRLAARLGEITGLRVIPSQGSAMLAELIGGMTAAQMAKVLLYKHNILIDTPDVPGGEYIRLSIRTESENDKLIEALRVSLA